MANGHYTAPAVTTGAGLALLIAPLAHAIARLVLGGRGR
jgi:hypothetical protein